ncbi:MAG TPA: hypothetical protein PLB88_06640, partial [Thermoanaerobaculaceae bacterium]|nr:hypothetical protein [Thermoanaerobaculaceae bacterium]
AAGHLPGHRVELLVHRLDARQVLEEDVVVTPEGARFLAPPQTGALARRIASRSAGHQGSSPLMSGAARLALAAGNGVHRE